MAKRKVGGKRRPKERVRDRHEAMTLWCGGMTQDKIAKKLGVTLRTIQFDLKYVRDEWIANNDTLVTQYVADQMLRIDEQERRALAGWERSCRNAEKTTTTTAPDGVKIVESVEGQAGDPRFLTVVNWCIEQRLKLVGAYAPEKFVDATPVEFVDIAIESHEQYLDYETYKNRIADN